MLGGAAIAVSIGNLFVIMAFRGAEVATVSPFRYVSVVLSLVAGFLIWREVPDFAALCGAATIVAAGVYMIHCERLRARAAVAPSAGLAETA